MLLNPGNPNRSGYKALGVLRIPVCVWYRHHAFTYAKEVVESIN